MSATRVTKKSKGQRISYPLTLEPELAQRVETAAAKVKLSRADVMRLSIERGIDLLVDQLTLPKSAV